MAAGEGGHYIFMPTTWREVPKNIKYPKLNQNLEVEVAVIGGAVKNTFR